MPIEAKMGTVPFLQRDCPHFVELIAAEFYAFLTSIFFTAIVFFVVSSKIFQPGREKSYMTTKTKFQLSSYSKPLRKRGSNSWLFGKRGNRGKLKTLIPF
jgi:hypothetical protein